MENMVDGEGSSGGEGVVGFTEGWGVFFVIDFSGAFHFFSGGWWFWFPGSCGRQEAGNRGFGQVRRPLLWSPTLSPEVARNEYEKVRAQTMMRNNQVLHSLRTNTLASILNKSSAKSKVPVRQDSGSLYEPVDNEDIEQGAVDKVYENVPRKRMTMNVTMPSGGTRVSKRVMATNEQDQPARMTRKRTRETCSTEDGKTTNPQGGSTGDALVATGSTTSAQPDNHIMMSSEGEPNAMID